MTADFIVAAGRALYGERWQAPLARDLGVSHRTVRRWVSGESPMPEGVEADLRALLAEREQKIRGLAVDIC